MAAIPPISGLSCLFRFRFAAAAAAIAAIPPIVGGSGLAVVSSSMIFVSEASPSADSIVFTLR